MGFEVRVRSDTTHAETGVLNGGVAASRKLF